MSSSICGNCENFKPKQGERFFNCTSAKHAGVSYGMQVRADTRACDAFVPFKAASATPPTSVPEHAAKTMRKQPEDRKKRPTGLCPWGRGIIIAVLIIVILILAGLAYMCASSIMSSPEATPTPTPTPTIPVGTPVRPTLPPTPTPKPIPTYEYQYYGIGGDNWAISPTKMVLIGSASRLSSYTSIVGMKETTAPSGMVFILINVTYVNRSSSAVSVSASSFVLKDSAGYTYPAQFLRNPYFFHSPFGDTVPRGESHNGNILYVVPIPVQGLEVSYLLDASAYPQQVAKWRLPW